MSTFFVILVLLNKRSIMLYTYCKESLSFKKVKAKRKHVVGSSIFILAAYFLLATAFNKVKADAYENGIEVAVDTLEPEVVVLVDADSYNFSQEALVKEIKRLNIRFPHIVLAQAILETGYYESRIYQENNNLFGMKQARARSTTAVGTQLGHAYYDHWKESVMDYALYQNAYVNKIRNEGKYLKYLDKNYAEAKNYDEKLKTIIERERLEELFLD